MFTDGQLDTAIADPDLRWDGSQWHLYYQTPHGDAFDPPGPMIIRHATSADLAAWTFDDTPALTVASDGAAWDATHTETPTVVYNPDAPADRRYLLLYSGASATFPGYAFPAYSIGAAFSADGVTFTRVPAADSPHGQDGLVLTGADAYPGAGGAIVADPEVALLDGTYHLWFSSFSCNGTDCATADAYGIGHATSTDGVHWTVDAAPITSLLRASSDRTSGGAQPSVIYDDLHCRWEMWLTSDSPATENDDQPIEFNNMVGVWHATSTNGTSWSINYQQARDLVWDQTASGEHLGLLTGADVAAKGNGRYLVYVGFDDQDVPTGSYLPDRTMTGFQPGVMALNLATRDAP
ncbi:MAG TPA: hypothetical protein VFS15_18745 [Kofleriaceae bacterium]|nr:hypothetical protein [Kofleriaceae bacterium]